MVNLRPYFKKGKETYKGDHPFVFVASLVVINAVHIFLIKPNGR